MKRMTKTKSILISVGLLINVIAQITTHFHALGDFAIGALQGIGIGVMLLSLFWKRWQAYSHKSN